MPDRQNLRRSAPAKAAYIQSGVQKRRGPQRLTSRLRPKTSVSTTIRQPRDLTALRGAERSGDGEASGGAGLTEGGAELTEGGVSERTGGAPGLACEAPAQTRNPNKAAATL